VIRDLYEMARLPAPREHSGVRGLARAPWDERDDDGAAADAADAREAQRAVDDTDPRHLAAAVALGAASLRAHRAAVQCLPWERGWTLADAAIGGAR